MTCIGKLQNTLKITILLIIHPNIVGMTSIGKVQNTFGRLLQNGPRPI